MYGNVSRRETDTFKRLKLRSYGINNTSVHGFCTPIEKLKFISDKKISDEFTYVCVTFKSLNTLVLTLKNDIVSIGVTPSFEFGTRSRPVTLEPLTEVSGL